MCRLVLITLLIYVFFLIKYNFLQLFTTLMFFLQFRFANSENVCNFAPHFSNAQMAESVDALVSNTSGATHPGSTPGLGTKNGEKFSPFFFCHYNIFLEKPQHCFLLLVAIYPLGIVVTVIINGRFYPKVY